MKDKDPGPRALALSFLLMAALTCVHLLERVRVSTSPIGQKRTISKMRDQGIDLRSYEIDHIEDPRPKSDVAASFACLSPEHIATLSARDGWAGPLRDTYAGDSAFATRCTFGLEPPVLEYVEWDVLYDDGRLVSAPEGCCPRSWAASTSRGSG